MSTAPPVPGARPGSLSQGFRAAVPVQPTGPAKDRLPRARRQRRPALAVGGALLVLLCGVTSAALATAGNDRLEVLALARDVQAGQILAAQDLRVAHLAGSGLSALSAQGAAGIVGQTVTATLPAGTLLNNRMLTQSPLPAGGRQLVAVAVKPGGVPAEAVPGRDVTLVRVITTADPQPGAAPTVLVSRARVVSVRSETTNGLVVLSVQVPDSAAVPVAQASAAGAVAVTLLPVAS